jgi:hypothetical protein
MEKGCFIVKDNHENVERYPLFENEIGEVTRAYRDMCSPRKVLLVEKISYVEEALKHLRKQLRSIAIHIDVEYEKVVKELEMLKSREHEVSEETFKTSRQNCFESLFS